MSAISPYYTRQLTRKEIAKGEHRNFVGGFWHEIGTLQFEFLLRHGLLPGHKLVDIGCGALRCGLPIIRYLETGNYFGLDINESLLEGGKRELALAELTDKRPKLLLNNKFELDRFGVLFDFAIAQSLFTHLDMNSIVRCLREARKVLHSGSKFFISFLQAPHSGHLEQVRHEPGGVVSNLDSDPYHYSFAELQWLAASAGFTAELVGNWNHPRNLQMLQLSTDPVK
jgi:cyclopropane fatty-acyl-phospholipid synthase-like methyltransferase